MWSRCNMTCQERPNPNIHNSNLITSLHDVTIFFTKLYLVTMVGKRIRISSWLSWTIIYSNSTWSQQIIRLGAFGNWGMFFYVKRNSWSKCVKPISGVPVVIFPEYLKPLKLYSFTRGSRKSAVAGQKDLSHELGKDQTQLSKTSTTILMALCWLRRMRMSYVCERLGN